MTGETYVSAIFGKDPPSIIDGREHVTRPGAGRIVRRTSQWSGDTLVAHQAYTIDGTDYISETERHYQGKILTIAEDYREPGMQRIRDWVFEKQ